MLHRVWKPWYVYHPSQLLLRVFRGLRRATAGFHPLPVAWGVSVLADPTKTIGRSIWTTGIYDIAVSELMARLIQAGDTVIDAGANIGYMTLLAAVAAGKAGKVMSFEPHPELFRVLERNVSEVGKELLLAQILLHNSALGAESGEARLIIPDSYANNDGMAYIDADASQATRFIPVAVETIDEVLGAASVAVMKLDVEGYELAVLQGSRRALESHRIRHILFEDHQGRGSKVVELCISMGYRVFSVGWAVSGPRIAPIENGRLATDYEAPSYLASIKPQEAITRCRPRGWLVLEELSSSRRTTQNAEQQVWDA